MCHANPYRAIGNGSVREQCDAGCFSRGVGNHDDRRAVRGRVLTCSVLVLFTPARHEQEQCNSGWQKLAGVPECMKGAQRPGVVARAVGESWRHVVVQVAGVALHCSAGGRERCIVEDEATVGVVTHAGYRGSS